MIEQRKWLEKLDIRKPAKRHQFSMLGILGNGKHMKTKNFFIPGMLVLMAPFITLAKSSPPIEDYRQWAQFKDITIATNGITATDLENFPVLVRLMPNDSDVQKESQSQGSDIRFSASDGRHLAYQIDHWDSPNRGQAAFWVSVDLKANSSTTIRMHWGRAGAIDSSNGPGVFSTNRGYQGVWHLGGGVKGNQVGTIDNIFSDAVGNSPPGINHGSILGNGPLGPCRSFNGVSAYAYLGNSPKLNFTGGYTIQAWVRWLEGGMSGTLNRRHILTHGNSSTPTRSQTALRLLKENYFVGSYDAITKNEPAVTAPIAGDSSTWVQLTGTYDGNFWKLYKNGVLVGIPMASPQGPMLSDSGWFLGASVPIDRFFSGEIDEARISNVARSADWIKFEYANQQVGTTVVTLGRSQNGSLSVRRLGNSNLGKRTGEIFSARTIDFLGRARLSRPKGLCP